MSRNKIIIIVEIGKSNQSQGLINNKKKKRKPNKKTCLFFLKEMRSKETDPSLPLYRLTAMFKSNNPSINL